jgi:LacI family transcriptional regulator
MTRSKTIASSRPRGNTSARSVSLKFLAEHLGLSPATVSLVINRSPAAKSIPHHTQERIREAARKLNYRPNFMARSLRAQRSFTIGVVVPEISEGYAALVLSGIEDHLLEEGYFYFVVSHRHRADLIEEYPHLLQQRAVEGLIAVDTECQKDVPIPVVAVSGHREVEGVTNIVLDHALAAKLAMEHLAQLGHRKIAFIKGQKFSSDTEIRWEAEQGAAKELGSSTANRRRPKLGTVSRESCWRRAKRSRRCLRSMIFPQLARSARCGKRDAAYRRTFRSWVSMIFKARRSRIPV